MRKHQFVKEDCKCLRRATYYVCSFCGAREYLSEREIRRLPLREASCPHPEATPVPAQDRFRGSIGGTFDCLGPEQS